VWPANAIRFQGDVIVVEMPADAPWRVVRTDGDDMATRREIGGSILKQPLGLAADEDNLWVTDYEAGRVVQVVADGVELEEPVVIASDLNHPEGIAIAPDGRLLLAETGTGRLLAIEASTGNADVIAEGLDFMQDNPTSIGPVSLPPQYIFSGVAVGPSGNVYVSGDGANVIYRILLGEPQSLDAELIAKIEALVEQEMADKDIPGVSLGIVKDGQVAYAKGFGVAERDTDRAMTPQTQFPVACITKGFTTAAIMQLVEQGLVDLDAPVTDYLPYFKLADERYKEITIHHLLANTAGLPMPDYVTLYGGFSHNPSWSPDLLEKYVRSLADKPMATDPADNIFMYGGDYFDILGDVIAKVSGQPFEEYMDQYILQPLGLEHTTFIVDELDPELAAAAYWQDENGEMQVSVPSPTYYPAHTPSNGMFSTTEDLLKWAIFNLNRGELDGRQIVPASAYDEMWKPQTEIPWGGIYQHWGYGWGISDLEDHRLVFWGGGHIGAPTAYYLAPDENLAVYVAANRSLEAVKGTEYADEIAFPIVEMLLGINGSEETK
jgi:CubicO group peptidase (beta-lactamase class C family)